MWKYFVAAVIVLFALWVADFYVFDLKVPMPPGAH